MANINKYPYHDYNDLNLDWVIRTVKETVAEWATYHAQWDEWKDDTIAAFNDLHDYVMNYFANLDIDAELTAILNRMDQDGSLKQIMMPYFAEWSQGIVVRLTAVEAAVGGPLVSSTVAGMADHTKVYVYTGSESGYTSGNWYYWDGAAWTSGGTYNAAALSTDTALTVAGAAADALETGNQVFYGGAYETLGRSVTTHNGTTNGITYAWSSKNICHLSGTASALSFSNILEDASSFPARILPGMTVYATISGNVSGVSLRIALQPSTLPDRIFTCNDFMAIPIPATATGLTARINVAGGTAIPAGGIDITIGLFTTKSNIQLSAETDSLAYLTDRFLSSAEVTALSGLLDMPVNKCASMSGTRLLALDPGSNMPIISSRTYFVKCYEYSSLYKWFDVMTVDGFQRFTGWTASSHPSSITWSNLSGEVAGDTFRVLIFGNSSSYSVAGYVPQVWGEMAQGLNITLGILYISGGSLDDHITAFTNDTNYTEYSLWSGSAWTNQGNAVTAKTVLDQIEWDLIILQQSNDDLMAGSGKADIDTLAGLIAGYISHPAKIAFMMPMARGANSTTLIPLYPDIADGEDRSDAAYADISDYCKDSLDYSYIAAVIPAGTAVQNARHTTLKTYGVEGYLCYDNVGHLQNGIGPLCAAYASAMALLKLADGDRFAKVFGDQWNPTDAELQSVSYWVRSTHGTCVGITSANKILAARCAMQAMKFPWDTTPNTPA